VSADFRCLDCGCLRSFPHLAAAVRAASRHTCETEHVTACATSTSATNRSATGEPPRRDTDSGNSVG